MTVKCCFCLKLKTGCLVLGAVTFLLALLMTSGAITFITLEEFRHKAGLTLIGSNATHIHQLNHILELPLSKEIIDVVLGHFVVLGGLWMMFSAMLITGILTSNPTRVMSYFLFASAICIIFFLCSLLEVVNGMWVLSVTTMTLTAIYVRCLIFVYNAYDTLLQEKTVSDRVELLFEEEFSTGE